MQLNSNPFLNLPKEVVFNIIEYCDAQTTGRLAQAFTQFSKIISNHPAPNSTTFFLAKEIILLDQKTKEISHQAECLISNLPTKKCYIKKITSSQLLKCHFNELFEHGIDALCDIKSSVFKELLLLNDATQNQKAMFGHAQLRSKGDIAPAVCSFVVIGDYPEDHSGRRYGKYGFEQSWQVCCLVAIKSANNDDWSQPLNNQAKSIQYAIDVYLPVALFYGKKEGDVVWISLHDRQFKLTCRQEPCRLGNNFEQVMLSMASSSPRVWIPRPGEPSEEEQRKMHDITKAEYYNSLS